MLHSLHLQKSLSSYNYIRGGAQLKVSFFSENQEEHRLFTQASAALMQLNVPSALLLKISVQNLFHH